MTMVSSGPISLGGNATTGGLNQSINVELGLSPTATVSLNQANVRTLLGVPSGAISLNDAYGKANQFAFTISSNQTNANLRTLAVNAGWNQTTKVVATISGGVYISSNSTGTPALNVNGSFPGGVELINNGFIVGMGGAGGNGANGFSTGGTASAGGLALSVSSAITINNASGTIAGGGGGGGGGGGSFQNAFCVSGGGGGGGGGRSSNAANSAGGARGTGNGGSYDGQPGNAGTVSSAGTGGAGATASLARGGTGGTGGGWGSTGSNGAASPGPSCADRGNGGAGGSGGGAISGNSNITWTAFGTRLGGIS